MLIDMDHVSKTYQDRPLLNQISFALEEKDKVALVGGNGTGKSTFLRLMAGKETCDQGTIRWKKALRIAYLPQQPQLNDTLTVEEQVKASARKDSQEYEIKAILYRLGIDDLDAQIATLSGGQRKRVALAQVLLQEYDVLLLDEPTNHLDAAMIEWLEAYLIKRTQAVFMVTHDRYFMERITNRMAELDHGRLYTYQGNYETYLEEKQLRLAQAAQREHKRQQLLKKEWEWVHAGVQARGTKSRDRLARFEKLQAEAAPQSDQAVTFTMSAARLGKKTITIHQLGKQYEQKCLFHDFSYAMKRYERIGILGPNGCGKTTLLKILAGQIQPDSGSIEYGETVKIGYFQQHSEWENTNQRVWDLLAAMPGVDRDQAISLCEQLGFDRAKLYQPLARLSGGEQRRLQLLAVLMQDPNILLLDEPTNDLDLETLQALEEMLDQFCGGIFVVSHDRYFLDRLCDTMFVFQPDGTILTMIGGYSQAMLALDHKPHQSASSQVKPQPRPRQHAMSTKEKREWEQMEAVLTDLERQLAQIDAQMAASEDYHQQQALNEQRMQLEQQLEKGMERWIVLEEKRNASRL